MGNAKNYWPILGNLAILANTKYWPIILTVGLFKSPLIYLDLDTNLDIDIKLGTSINLDYSLYIESDAESNVELDSKAKEILKDIT